MDLKLQVQNYQIIKKASLTFIPGLNVIIGPSNNGKSSLLKAMRALIYTVPGTTPIKSGEQYYAVGINYNNHTIILQKGLKESVYIVDGEKYSKYGTTTPEIVSKYLNMKELVLNNNKVQLNFWNQMDYPFLIDKTASELFKFIVDSSDSDQVTLSLKDMVSDRQKLSKDIDLLQGSINSIDLDIENHNKTLQDLKFKVEVCNKIIELQSKISRYKQLKNIKEQHLVTKKQLDDTNLQYEKINSSYKINKYYSEALELKIRHFYELNDKFIKLHNLIGDMSNLEANINNLLIYKKFKTIDMTDLNKLKEYKQKLDNIKNQKENIKLPKVIKSNISKEKLDKIMKLKEYYNAIKDIENKNISNNEKIQLIKEKIDSIIYIKRSFKVCPYCGQTIH